MSNKALTWAWSQSLKPAPKLVLLALADHADDRGYCWPSLARLAEMTGIDRSTVTRSLAVLEQHRLIARDRSTGGPGKSTRYYIGEQVQDAPVKQVPETPDTDPNRCERSHNRCERSQKQVRHAPRTIKNPQEPPESERKRAHPLPDTFKLTSPMQAWGSEKFPTVNLQQETEKFADHARAKNRKLTDWVAGWRNWIRQAHDYQQARGNSAPNVAPKLISEELF